MLISVVIPRHIYATYNNILTANIKQSAVTRGLPVTTLKPLKKSNDRH